MLVRISDQVTGAGHLSTRGLSSLAAGRVGSQDAQSDLCAPVLQKLRFELLRVGDGGEEVDLAVQIVDHQRDFLAALGRRLRLAKVDQNRKALGRKEVPVHKGVVAPHILSADHDILACRRSVGFHKRKVAVAEREAQSSRLKRDEETERGAQGTERVAEPRDDARLAAGQTKDASEDH
eukprot:CAMPEP_0185317054 /NCGR_PEP_ID=MMETSP1363-20130426/45748_1 /TAXON_ID=38817 /ORGANISM="Gephyrocapsa oceanica, Strain RCC1303" /LENGTH=178 /DNA_ID=CAMNT_0027915293 /DNA_START=83 /DNA_END=619 /DNA_ORIENTATION=-